MLNYMKLSSKVVLAGLLAFGLMGCGSATNNDQGTAFTALGFFKTFPESEDKLPSGDAGILAPFGGFTYGRDDQGNLLLTPTDTEVPTSQSIITSIIGIANNLSGQAINLTAAEFRYEIAGFNEGISIPRRGYAISGTISPGSTDSAITGASEGNSSSSLPDGFGQGGIPTKAFLEVVLVDQDLMNLLIANKSALPTLPFFMTVYGKVKGISTSGDVYESNEVAVSILFSEPLGSTITPTDGTTDSTTTG